MFTGAYYLTDPTCDQGKRDLRIWGKLWGRWMPGGSSTIFVTMW
jgi:hypothetical protein